MPDTQCPSDDVCLGRIEAFALELVLWNVANDPSVPHDRKVEAIHLAALVHLALGIPGWPTHPEATVPVTAFFEKVAKGFREWFALSEVETAAVDVTMSLEVRLPHAEDIFQLLCEVVADRGTKYDVKAQAAYVISSVGPKIWKQMPLSAKKEQVGALGDVARSVEDYVRSLQRTT